MPASRREEWLWGWDPTPGIVSVWATHHGRAIVWRRIDGSLVREEARFRPWMLVASLADVEHLGRRLVPEGAPRTPTSLTYEELEGPGALRWIVRSDDGRLLARAVLDGASRRLGRELRSLRDLPPDGYLALPAEEQYLTETGRTYFRGLGFDDLVRVAIDLETTGLDPEVDRIFLVAVGAPDGTAFTLEAEGDDDAAEADLLARLFATVRRLDPDVIENHNLHGFDLPFIAARCAAVGVAMDLGRDPEFGARKRPASRGARLAGAPSDDPMRRARFTVAGRELVDTLDAVRRYDFASRELPGHGLKAVARHLGLAREDRELIPGAMIADVHRRDPERVRRYAKDDVLEAKGLARMLGGAAFALARMVPRRYERLADAGAATGVLDPLLVRAYVRERAALPSKAPSDGTEHTGAALRLFASGVARRIVKADVASLYPSLMRTYRIGPSRDRLGALLAIVDQLVEQRLEAKAKGKAAPAGSAERHTHEAMSAAMKLVVNSAYGYLGATSLTRFADVHAANEVTRRGREVLGTICGELASRGMTLVEADTDGVYFSVPASFGDDDERRVVAEVGALLPPLVRLELEGRYRAMLSHEPKNYALLPYGDDPVVLRGVAFRSSRAEPFGEDFLRRAITRLLEDDVPGVRQEYVASVTALRRRELPTLAVASRMRLTKSPGEYRITRSDKRELAYEAVLASGRSTWSPGERVLVYRAQGGRAALAFDQEMEDEDDLAIGLPRARGDQRDYDVDLYVGLLRSTYAERLTTAFRKEDFEAVFADPIQPSLFAPALDRIRPILRILD